MAIEIKIDEDNQIRISTIIGKLTFEDLLNNLKEIYSDHVLYDLPYSIWDIRQADISSFTTEQIQKLAEFVAGSWGMEGSKKAAIVADKALLYGLSRMYEKTLEFKTPSSTMVFHNYDEALAWIKEGTLPSSSPGETIIG